jgi:hypothetical protein
VTLPPAGKRPETKMSEGMQTMATKFLPLSFIAFAEMCLATTLPAQTAVWRIDSVHSTARLFVASSDRKDRVNVGVARMSGELHSVRSHPPSSALSFQIYEADRGPIPPVAQGSTPQNLPAWDATVISFQSESVQPGDENIIRVRGELTAMYTSRQTFYGPNFRDYAGPRLGPPQRHSQKQEVTLVFRKTGRGGLANVEWLGSTAVRSTEFPTLWNAVLATVWPPFEMDGQVMPIVPRTDIHCVMPSMVTNSFSGEVCKGTPIVTLSDPDGDSVPGANASGASASVANEVQIELYMLLVQR